MKEKERRRETEREKDGEKEKRREREKKEEKREKESEKREKVRKREKRRDKERKDVQGQLGKLVPTKTDEFSEKFQTALDTPPHFRKIMLRIFSKIHDRSTPL